MGPPKSLFTKASLEKLSSPEQLDVLMEVTKPMGWIGLASTGLLLLMGILWGIFGSIPIRVDGKGILIMGGSVIPVEARSAGQITEILVKPGDVIKANQEVAILSQGGLEENIRNEEATLADLEGKFKSDSANEQATYDATLIGINSEVTTLNSQVSGAAVSKEGFRLALERLKLADPNAITKGAKEKAERDLIAATNAEKDLQTQLKSIDTKRAAAKQKLEAAATSGKNAIAEQKRKIVSLKGQLTSSQSIRTNLSGRVIEMTVALRDSVKVGDSVLSLEPLDATLTGVIYIASGEGKKANPNMEVRISPSTVKAEEFGFMKGTVRSVSTYPATPAGLLRTLRNEVLVKELAGNSAPLEVVVDLIKAPNVSGYEWSSPMGPPVGIFGGTMCTGSIILERKRPISYVIPEVKKKLGM